MAPAPKRYKHRPSQSSISPSPSFPSSASTPPVSRYQSIATPSPSACRTRLPLTPRFRSAPAGLPRSPRSCSEFPTTSDTCKSPESASPPAAPAPSTYTPGSSPHRRRRNTPPNPAAPRTKTQIPSPATAAASQIAPTALPRRSVQTTAPATAQNLSPGPKSTHRSASARSCCPASPKPHSTPPAPRPATRPSTTSSPHAP